MEPSEDKRLGAGRVAFLARIDTFREMIEAGNTMQVIYEKYQSHLGIGYNQFVNYVNRYIRKKENVPAIEIKFSKKKESEKPKSGFVHDPEGASRDDLI